MGMGLSIVPLSLSLSPPHSLLVSIAGDDFHFQSLLKVRQKVISSVIPD